ncbi:MAG: Rsd/AlgQ family anti-sigma factor [Pseudomonadota bacterium]
MAPVPHHSSDNNLDASLGLIARWRSQRLGLRKHLLQLMCARLSSSTPMEQEVCLENLCVELIDYISIGHFEIYGSLMRRQSRSNQELGCLIAYLHRCIGSSTDLALAFNESCECPDILLASDQMTEALTKLTRSLLVRFALEEQMLELTTCDDNWH